MLKVSIVNGASVVDVYSDGEYRFSIFDGMLDGALPLSSDDEVAVYQAGGSPDFVSTRTGRQPRNAGYAVVQVNKEIRVIAPDHSFQSFYLEDYLREPMDALENEVLQRQDAAGFFAPSAEQIQSLRSYLFAYLSSLPSVPSRIHIPVFAYFNYARMDEMTADESDIPRYWSVHADPFLPENLFQPLGHAVSSRLERGTSCDICVKSRLLRDIIDSLNRI